MSTLLEAPHQRLSPARCGPWPCSILGTGAALPSRVLDNQTLIEELRLDTTAEWIASRTGIRQRRFLQDGQSLVQLATDAALSALESSQTDPDQIDLVVVATSTSEHLMPSLASLVQANLKAHHAAAFDVNAACSGFATAFEVAYRWLQVSGERVLVIGADRGSRLFGPQDRTASVFFGDAAGAVILGADGTGEVLASELHSRGDLAPLRVPADGFMTMDGKAVWNFATEVLPNTVRSLCDRAGVSVDQIDLLVPHQANINILQSSAQELGIPMNRVVTTIDHLGNTVAASIPTALDRAFRDGRIQPGDLVAMVGFGAGLAWGGQLLRI